MRYRRQLWLYPLFQIPLMLMLGCLVVAALCWLLDWGKPPVAVAISLDLSGSTSGVVRQQEIEAIKSYLSENKALKTPNEIQVFGFASQGTALSNTFTTDSKQVETELNQSLQNPNLQQKLGGGTDLNLAIDQATNALRNIQNRCRELLLVTDGQAQVHNSVINHAINNNVKINAVILGNQNAPDLQRAVDRTNGIYLSGEAEDLKLLFTQTFFARFNSNLRWVIFWLGAALISFMWMLTLPLDRWFFQGWVKLDMTLAGQLALGNALFWTILTITVVWKVFGLPFGGAC